MSSYRGVANEFQLVGYRDTMCISGQQLGIALDKIAYKNASLFHFDRSVSEQLFEQASKEAGSVLVEVVIGTILQAQQHLRKNIKVLQLKYRQQTDGQSRRQCLYQLSQFQEDLKLLTVTFGQPEPEKLPELEGYRESELIGPDKSLKTRKSLPIDGLPEKEKNIESLDLVVVFILASLWLCFDLLGAFQKNNFLSMLSAMSILGIFWLPSFDKHYMRMCIVVVFVSLALDLIWLLSMFGIYWHPALPSHRFPHALYLRLVFILTIILMVAKLMVLLMIYPYRSNTPDFTKTVRLYSRHVDLNGRPTNNPMAHLFGNRREVLGLQ